MRRDIDRYVVSGSVGKVLTVTVFAYNITNYIVRITSDYIPEDTYIRNPKTGLWYKLTASIDELGNIVPEIETEGITR